MFCNHDILVYFVVVAAVAGSRAEEPRTSRAATPNVFIWGSPRTGTTVTLNALANSGYWGNNTHMEPLNMATLVRMVGGEHLFGVDARNMQDLVDHFAKDGPFLIKELVFALLLNGMPAQYARILNDTNTKHLFLMRKPWHMMRSFVMSLHKAGLFSPAMRLVRLGSGFEDNVTEFCVDLVHVSLVRKLYRYMTEVLGVGGDRIALLDFDDLRRAPSVVMPRVAAFLGVPFS